MKEIAQLNYQGQLRNALTHLSSGAELLTDAPLDNRGQGQSFSPTDLLACSLASCIVTIVGIEAADMGVDLYQVEARIYKQMKAEPRRVGRVRVDLNLRGNTSLEQRQLLEQKGRACPVALSLQADLIQEISFNWS